MSGSENRDAPLVAVLDYGIGNLRSAQKALQRVGADARLTADPALVAKADGVVLPGVGAFGRCVEALMSAGIWDMAFAGASAAANGTGPPFLGVCVGMQMLHEGSTEAPGVTGLGVLPGEVQLLTGDIKRPQMQWNRLDLRPNTAHERFLAGLGVDPWAYFVHSYAAPVSSDTVATCSYGGPVCAAEARGVLWGCQFHPEKSSSVGLQILENFVNLCCNPVPPVVALNS
ncbi:MAG: imidazole glycerol phosphate synthase subunit HisH [Acidimicrobiales bacterium]|nr:imidazole glycerol phosphate synthase subunit HisH [Acidimicrobiales bacterium]